MPQATSISLSKLTSSVQAAVKAAMEKHPKFKIDVPHGISASYLIRGIPVPDAILSTVSLGETQAFANDIAAHIAGVHPEVFAAAQRPSPKGAILSIGGHVLIGIPAVLDMVSLEK
jgi:hypothetical protein